MAPAGGSVAPLLTWRAQAPQRACMYGESGAPPPVVGGVATGEQPWAEVVVPKATVYASSS